jgi:hypothetical protein
MSHGNILDLNGTVFIEIPELMRVEIGSQVGDDGVGEAETMQDVAHEANRSICRECFDWLVLDPIGNLSMATNT